MKQDRGKDSAYGWALWRMEIAISTVLWIQLKGAQVLKCKTANVITQKVQQKPNGKELFLSIFSSISQSSDLQHQWAGPRAQRETYKGTIDKKKKNQKDLRKYRQYCLKGAEYISNHKKTFWTPLQFCVSVLDPHQRFFVPPILVNTLGKRNSNNPIQK